MHHTDCYNIVLSILFDFIYVGCPFSNTFYCLSVTLPSDVVLFFFGKVGKVLWLWKATEHMGNKEGNTKHTRDTAFVVRVENQWDVSTATHKYSEFCEALTFLCFLLIAWFIAEALGLFS